LTSATDGFGDTSPSRPCSPTSSRFLVGCLGSLVILAPWRSGTNGSLGGALLCLAAASSYGVSYIYQGRYLTNRGLSPLVLACGQMLTATVLAAVLVPLAGRQTVHLGWQVAGSVAVLGTLGTGVAYVLNFSLIATQGGTAASTVTYLLPVVSVALGVAVLGEALAWTLVLGTTCAGRSVASAAKRRRSQCTCLSPQGLKP
jgi:drug/metabolite transporter (DMT)-like permease